MNLVELGQGRRAS